MSILKLEEDKRKEFEKFFDKQIKTLKTRECPKTIIEAFEDQRNTIISKAIEMEIFEGNIPFLPVIPRFHMKIDKILSMITAYIENKKDLDYSVINKFKNIVDVPKDYYFIYNIEDGTKTIGKQLQTVENLIKRENKLFFSRSCLTFDEVISLCIHTNILNHHGVYCVGSRYEDGEIQSAPHIYIYEGNFMIKWRRLSWWGSGSGSPTCYSRN